MMAKRGRATKASEPTVHEQKPWLFKPGESGNPEGRPKGSRNKLGEAFLEALHKDFQEHGEKAIAEARAESPLGYVRVCASILPKQLNIKHDPLEDMTDDQLREYVQRIAKELGPFLAFGNGEDSGEAEGTTRH